MSDEKAEKKSYFDGGLLQWIGWKLLGGLVTLVTLGICYPWAVCMIYRWKINHTVVEGRRLKFVGRAGGLFGTWIKWLLLSIITLGIYSLWIPISLEKWRVKHTIFADEETPNGNDINTPKEDDINTSKKEDVSNLQSKNLNVVGLVGCIIALVGSLKPVLDFIIHIRSNLVGGFVDFYHCYGFIGIICYLIILLGDLSLIATFITSIICLVGVVKKENIKSKINLPFIFILVSVGIKFVIIPVVFSLVFYRSIRYVPMYLHFPIPLLIEILLTLAGTIVLKFFYDKKMKKD